MWHNSVTLLTLLAEPIFFLAAAIVLTVVGIKLAAYLKSARDLANARRAQIENSREEKTRNHREDGAKGTE